MGAEKRLPYESVKSLFLGDNYRLVSKQYKNTTSPLIVECNNGHIIKSSVSNFKAGKRCPICHSLETINRNKDTYDQNIQWLKDNKYIILEKTFVNRSFIYKIKCPKGHVYNLKLKDLVREKGNIRCQCDKRKRYTYSTVKNFIEEIDYNLLSKEYKDANSLLKIECPHGHIFKMNFNHFKDRNQRCPICYKQSLPNYNNISKYLNDHQYKLKSKVYINSTEKMEVECPKGHTFYRSWNSLRKTLRCPQCDHGGIKYSYDEVKRIIESNDYKLISKEYKNGKEKLELECPEGHNCLMSFNSFNHGNRCWSCARTKPLTYNEVKDYIENNDYILLSKTYNKAQDKLVLRCPNGHKCEIRFNNFRTGYRCSKCNASRGENLIKEILNNILPENIKYKWQYPAKINGHNRKYDFCIFTPKQKILIEYDGRQHFTHSFWDRTVSLDDRKKIDQEKTQWAINNGYSIFRYNYQDKDEYIHNDLYNRLKNEFNISVKLVNIDYGRARLRGKRNYTLQEVALYFLNHTGKDTEKKFGIDHTTASNYFKYTYGCTKTKYLKLNKEVSA